MKIKGPLSNKVAFGVLVAFSFLMAAFLVYMIFKIYAVNYQPKTIERVQGPDRYTTAVAVSQRQFAAGSTDRVLIATGENWPDAATSTVLAGKYKAPLLLTRSASLSPVTRDELVRLRPRVVTILGGPVSVSAYTEYGIRVALPGVVIDRIDGPDRYTVAARIADRIYALSNNQIVDGTAFFVTGADYADALSTGAMAASASYPILYVTSTSVPAATSSAIARLGIRRSVVVGTTASIPAGVFYQLPNPIRVAGTDRYSTSVAFADWALANIPNVSVNNVAVATGETFSDALAGDPFIAAFAVPGVLILSPLNMNAATYNFFNRYKAVINHVYVIGGTASISAANYSTIANMVLGTAMATQPAVTSDLDLARSIVNRYAAACPAILSGTTVDFGETYGYQALTYYGSKRIVINPYHTASTSAIMNHEIYHVYDWFDNWAINWGENIPPSPKPACITAAGL